MKVVEFEYDKELIFKDYLLSKEIRDDSHAVHIAIEGFVLEDISQIFLGYV